MELKTMKTSTAKTTFNHLRGLKLAALAIGSTFILAGCAGNPPSEQYAVTQSAVNSAVTAGGTEFAAVEMKAAQDKLKQAELAMHDKKYDEAKRLAEQAEWDARVAERKAQAAKAERAVHGRLGHRILLGRRVAGAARENEAGTDCQRGQFKPAQVVKRGFGSAGLHRLQLHWITPEKLQNPSQVVSGCGPGG